MKNKYTKLNLNELCTVDINISIHAIGKIFADNLFETIFVIDSAGKLCGIITVGDFLRKSTAATCVDALMNITYKKIEADLPVDEPCSDKIASAAGTIFYENPTIREIPIVTKNEKMLICAIARERGGDLFEPLREDIIKRFLIATELHQKSYRAIAENAKKQGIKFTAQAAQDLMAYLFFYDKKDGFYIDIGAHDGYTGSTTYWAEQIGWSGICVEPQKEQYDLLKKNRSCASYNVAISDKSGGSTTFIEFHGIATRSGIADTMTERHIEAAIKLGGNMVTTTANTLTFNDMMEDFPDVKHIDFISIDVECHEMNVLKSIDFSKFSFGLIAVETDEDSDAAKYIGKQGYRPLLRAYSDVLFVPNDYMPHLGKHCEDLNNLMKFHDYTNEEFKKIAEDSIRNVYQNASTETNELALRAYNALQDEESRRIFSYILLIHQLNKGQVVDATIQHSKMILETLNYRLLEKGGNLGDYKIYDRNFFLGWQYFGLSVEEWKASDGDEVFIDCGAFYGGSIKGFAEYCGYSYKKIYAFEPIHSNYEVMCKNVTDLGLKDVVLLNKGVWSYRDEVAFKEDMSGSKIDKKGNAMIEVVSIDETIPADEIVTFIKMDVEGAELEALRGAANAIIRCRPKLAISLYHKPNDIIDIPMYILSICSDYIFYIRHHHPTTMWETVLYAIPPNE